MPYIPSSETRTTDNRYEPFDLVGLQVGETLCIHTRNSRYWVTRTKLSYAYDDNFYGGFAVQSDTTSQSIRRNMNKAPFNTLVERRVTRGKIFRIGRTGETSLVRDFGSI